MIDMDLVYRNGIKPCGKKEFTGEYVLGHSDHELMLKLAKAGTDHRKFMRQMPLMMRITAPLYFWKEFDTYKIGTVSNSCSTMHTIAAKEFTLDDFSCEKLLKTSLKPINGRTQIDILQETVDALNYWRDNFNETKEKLYWEHMIQLLPNSYNQARNITMNYEAIANIYASRKSHKLDEWVQFCKLMESIPYFDIVKAACDKRTKSGDTNDENGQI